MGRLNRLDSDGNYRAIDFPAIKGLDGKDGKDGEDGKAGSTAEVYSTEETQIGVYQEEDGKYYPLYRKIINAITSYNGYNLDISINNSNIKNANFKMNYGNKNYYIGNTFFSATDYATLWNVDASTIRFRCSYSSRPIEFSIEYTKTTDAPVEPSSVIASGVIGEIISFMGTKAPKNFFACDGSTYNISDYPIFASYLMEQFGRYDYFGGDGTTTFAVPDLRGEFLRGSGTNSHANQGSGASVGEHQDGTKHCRINYNNDGNINYANGTFSPSNEDASTDTSSGSRYVKSTGYTTKYNRYYTSRPTNTSVLYCIRYK